MYRFFLMKGLFSCLLILGFRVLAGPPTCPVTSGAELITNGDFSAGNTGFTTDYTYATSSVGPAQYTVGANPNSVNSYFANIPDHTPTADGNMLITDVDGVTGKDVYSTTVSVVSGNTYFFSAWFANINTNTSCAKCSASPPKYENAPKLKFSINGVQIGVNVNVDSMSHNWEQFSAQWTSNTTGTITIKIENLITTSNGNDLAIDDVSFKAGCDGVRDLSALGKASGLVDTVYTCNENFPAYNLDTKLSNAKYAFNWYQSTSSLQSGIVKDDQKNGTSSSIYNIASAPANNTKYYVCYDSLGDKLTCPRLDSVLFLSQFNFDIPDQTVCPPVDVVLDPSLTTTNITSWKYERTLPTALTLSSGTGKVLTQTIDKAGTYKLTITHGNGSCTASPDIIKIDTLAAAFTGAISTACTGTNATGTAKLVADSSGVGSVTVVGGNVKVSWYDDITGGTKISGSGKSVQYAPASSLVKTTACPQGGLFLQDDNSYATTVALTNCGSNPPPSELNSSPSAVFQKITISAPTSVTSLNIFTKSNNGNGENLTVKVDLFAGTLTNFGSAGTPIATIAQRNLVGFTNTSLTSVSVPGTGYVIQPGTYYIRITSFETANTNNGKAIGVQSSCRSNLASNYKDGGTTPVISFDDEFRDNGNLKTGYHGAIFNGKFQVGNPTSCGRVWVCATCTLPVEYTYFNVYPTGGKDVLITWGTAHESKNRAFVVEASSDGVNFTAVAEVSGSLNSHLQKDYSVQQTMTSDRQYYRIKQVDLDGKVTYTPVRFVSLNGSDAIGEVYPQPVKHGEVLHVKINGLIDTQLTLKLQSISGLDISEQTVDIGENTEAITFDTGGLNAGVYLLLISNTDFAKTIRVVVE